MTGPGRSRFWFGRTLAPMGIAMGAATDALSSGASYPDIQQAIQQIQQKYDGLSGALYKKPKEIEKGAYTLGDRWPCCRALRLPMCSSLSREREPFRTPGRQAMGALWLEAS